MAHFSAHGLQEAKKENPNSSLIFQITIFSKTKNKKFFPIYRVGAPRSAVHLLRQLP